MKISRKMWDTLPKERQEILLKIGVQPADPPRKRKKTPVCFRPAEYTLKVEIRCQLCKTISFEYFRMSLMAETEDPFLHGDPLLKAPKEVDKEILRVRPTCSHCFRRLLIERSKEDIVRALMKTWPSYMRDIELNLRRG